MRIFEDVLRIWNIFSAKEALQKILTKKKQNGKKLEIELIFDFRTQIAE